MTEAIAFISLILVCVVGLTIINLLKLLEEEPLLEKVGYSFGIGLGIVSYTLYIYSRLNIGWNIVIVLLPWIIVSFFLLFSRRIIIKKIRFKANRSHILPNFLKILIFLQVIYVFIQSQLRPLVAWDGWATWLFRAKIFFVDGKINPYVLRVIDLEYPLLVSLAGTYIYLFVGEINDRVALLMYPFFYSSLLLIFYFFLKKQTNTLYALFFTFILASIQVIIRHSGRFDAGLADLPLSYYILAVSIITIKYITEQKTTLLLLVNILLAFVIQVKNEGLPLALTIQSILLAVLLMRKKASYLFFSSIWLVVAVDWIIYKSVHNLRINFHFERISINFFERIPIVIRETSIEFINIERWNVLWFIFALALLFYILYHRKKSISTIILLIIVFQLSVYGVIFIVTPYNLTTYVANVIDRLYLHIAPLATLFISLIFFPPYTDLLKREHYSKFINRSILGNFLKIKRVSLKNEQKVKNRKKIKNNKQTK